ncbi:MAG: DNA-directed RNA polymerase subunit omega [bacterium]
MDAPLDLEVMGRSSMNKYQAVIIAAREARRINDLASNEETEQPEKPIITALKRLADEKLKGDTTKEEEV